MPAFAKGDVYVGPPSVKEQRVEKVSKKKVPAEESNIPASYGNTTGVTANQTDISSTDTDRTEVKATGTVVKTRKVVTVTYSNPAKLARPPIRSYNTQH